MKKNLYKKILNKWLANAVLGVDNTLSFKIYKACFTVIDDYITRFNNNYKEFLFKTTLESEYIKLAIESAEGDVMKWEMTITTLKLGKQKIRVKSNQKKTKLLIKKKKK